MKYYAIYTSKIIDTNESKEIESNWTTSDKLKQRLKWWKELNKYAISTQGKSATKRYKAKEIEYLDEKQKFYKIKDETDDKKR